MAAEKFLKLVSGVITEIASDATGGTGDGGIHENKIVSLDATGQLNVLMMPTGIGPDIATLPITETLAAGDLVNVYDSTGVKARKADASVAGKEANGFTLAGGTYPSPGTAVIYFGGLNTGVSALTPGALYYLGTTAGLPTATPPSGSAQVVQRVGRATDAGVLVFQPGDPVTLAT
jgi:hypothetical protein